MANLYSMLVWNQVLPTTLIILDYLKNALALHQSVTKNHKYYSSEATFSITSFLFNLETTNTLYKIIPIVPIKPIADNTC